MVMGSEATNACKYDQLCAGLKAGINRELYEVQSIWEDNSTKANWGFLLVEENNAFN